MKRRHSCDSGEVSIRSPLPGERGSDWEGELSPGLPRRISVRSARRALASALCHAPAAGDEEDLRGRASPSGDAAEAAMLVAVAWNSIPTKEMRGLGSGRKEVVDVQRLHTQCHPLHPGVTVQNLLKALEQKEKYSPPGAPKQKLPPPGAPEQRDSGTEAACGLRSPSPPRPAFMTYKQKRDVVLQKKRQRELQKRCHRLEGMRSTPPTYAFPQLMDLRRKAGPSIPDCPEALGSRTHPLLPAAEPPAPQRGAQLGEFQI